MRTCSSGITEATTTSAPARVSVSVMHEVSISSLSSATGTSTVRRLACSCMHTLDDLVRLSAGAAARATRPRASVVWARSSTVRPRPSICSERAQVCKCAAGREQRTRLMGTTGTYLITTLIAAS